MPRPIIALVLVLAAGPALAEPGDPGAGAELYRSYCAACHGPEARGDGAMAGMLTVPPADLTRLAATNGGVFPVFRVVRRIDGRAPLLAHGGEMPLFGRLFDMTGIAVASEHGQPILTSQPIADLAAWLATIQEPR